jgi:uncharacterized membrane protein YjjP (DUF1212 family)
MKIIHLMDMNSLFCVQEIIRRIYRKVEVEEAEKILMQIDKDINCEIKILGEISYQEI